MNSAGRLWAYLLKRWYVILLCALVGAGAMYVEKGHVAPSVAVNGDLLYTRVLRTEPVPVVHFGGTAEEVVLVSEPVTWRVIQTLIDEWDKSLDIEKLDKSWRGLKLNDQLQWIGKHAHFVHIGPGLYEIEVQFASTDAKDTEYIEQHAQEMMDAFERSLTKSCAAQLGGSKFVQVDEFSLVNTGRVVTQGTLQKKYIAIGFVLGALAGAAVLAVLSLRRREEG